MELNTRSITWTADRMMMRKGTIAAESGLPWRVRLEKKDSYYFKTKWRVLKEPVVRSGNLLQKWQPSDLVQRALSWKTLCQSLSPSSALSGLAKSKWHEGNCDQIVGIVDMTTASFGGSQVMKMTCSPYLLCVNSFQNKQPVTVASSWQLPGLLRLYCACLSDGGKATERGFCFAKTESSKEKENIESVLCSLERSGILNKDTKGERISVRIALRGSKTLSEVHVEV